MAEDDELDAETALMMIAALVVARLGLFEPEEAERFPVALEVAFDRLARIVRMREGAALRRAQRWWKRVLPAVTRATK